MIPWVWIPVAAVAGALLGFTLCALLIANEPTQKR